MMGDMSREPSMEDILSSIRRVIARDETPGTVQAPRPAGSDDVLDLHDQEVEEDVAEPVKDAVEPAPRTAEPVADVVEPVEEDEELVSAASADAARQSLEALSAAIAPPPPTAAASASASGRTMEDVVVDTLRPMLKDWLDANLPPLVEAMVAKEIRRITGRKF